MIRGNIRLSYNSNFLFVKAFFTTGCGYGRFRTFGKIGHAARVRRRASPFYKEARHFAGCFVGKNKDEKGLAMPFFSPLFPVPI